MTGYMEITQVCACEKSVQGKNWIIAVTLHLFVLFYAQIEKTSIKTGSFF